MAHFYGTAEGGRGEATRCGTKSSGMITKAASWAGAVQTTLTVRKIDGEEVDWAYVELTPWHGNGVSVLLYSGPVSGEAE